VATIAVFDSGLGSLGVVRAIRRISRCDIIYYADTASHPYGTKPVDELRRIIHGTIRGLRERFAPDLVVVGSNTPTLLLDSMEDHSTMGVRPPLREAARIGRAATVLATRSVVESGAVRRYAESLGLDLHIREVDASALVRMAETGAFLDDPEGCRGMVSEALRDVRGTCILSSTHLPFLRDVMESVRPDVVFLDPAYAVAGRAVSAAGAGGGGTLRVYSSGGHDIAPLLRRLGVSEEVSRLSLCGSHV
jgi:glutamate racemase